jgi:hypothetical protein
MDKAYIIILVIVPLVFLFLMLFVSAVYQIKAVNKLLKDEEYLQALTQKALLLKIKPIALNKLQPWFIGYLAIIIGSFCLATNWTTSDFWGIFLTILGYQITFWALGIRSSFLGNDFEENKTRKEYN